MRSIKARMSSSNFKKCWEMKKNTKKLKWTLKGHILGTVDGFSLKLESEVSHLDRIYTEKFMCFCSGSVELQMRLLYFCKIHTCLLRAWVSWAVQNTTVRLDITFTWKLIIL